MDLFGIDLKDPLQSHYMSSTVPPVFRELRTHRRTQHNVYDTSFRQPATKLASWVDRTLLLVSQCHQLRDRAGHRKRRAPFTSTPNCFGTRVYLHVAIPSTMTITTAPTARASQL